MRYNQSNAFARFLFSPEPDPGGGGAGGGGTSSTPPLIGDDLSFSEGWQDRVGEHAQGMTFTNLPDTLKSYRESQSTIGRLNTEKAQIAKEFEEFKVANQPAEFPKEVADYQKLITLPEKMPEGVVMPEGMLEAAAKYGIEKGHSPKAVSDFIEFQINQVAGDIEGQKAEAFRVIESAKAQINAEVGEQNYDLTISNAKAASQILGLDLDPESLATNPKLVIALSKIHKKISPGELKDLGLSPEGRSAAGASQKADDILNNKENPYHKAFYDHTDPNHDMAQAEFNRLIAEAGSES